VNERAVTVAVAPSASEEEVVAIVAAIEALWPRPAVHPIEPHPTRSAWRFSGRWWSRPIPVRRDRPFH
jgi:hypothetical protein